MVLSHTNLFHRTQRIQVAEGDSWTSEGIKQLPLSFSSSNPGQYFPAHGFGSKFQQVFTQQMNILPTSLPHESSCSYKLHCRNSPTLQMNFAKSPPGTHHPQVAKFGGSRDFTCTGHHTAQRAISKELFTQIKQTAQGLELLAVSHRALPVMVVDNHMILDYLLAAEGGICTLDEHLAACGQMTLAKFALQVARDTQPRGHNITLLTKQMDQIRISFLIYSPGFSSTIWSDQLQKDFEIQDYGP